MSPTNFLAQVSSQEACLSLLMGSCRARSRSAAQAMLPTQHAAAAVTKQLHDSAHPKVWQLGAVQHLTDVVRLLLSFTAISTEVCHAVTAATLFGSAPGKAIKQMDGSEQMQDCEVMLQRQLLQRSTCSTTAQMCVCTPEAAPACHSQEPLTASSCLHLPTPHATTFSSHS